MIRYRSNPGVSNWALQEGRISSPMSVHTSVNRLYVEEPAPNLDRNETSKKGYCMVQDVGRDADVDVLRGLCSPIPLFPLLRSS